MPKTVITILFFPPGGGFAMAAFVVFSLVKITPVPQLTQNLSLESTGLPHLVQNMKHTSITQDMAL